MIYFDHILHTYACQRSITTDMRNHLFHTTPSAKLVKRADLVVHKTEGQTVSGYSHYVV